ncbi:MAG: hypothetical protein R3B41_03155, partial [Candidatus Doudnabacteria bacterium]
MIFDQPILINKKLGETPLDALNKFRDKHQELTDLPITYAGRLDPMASGALLLLAGPLVHQKHKFLKLNKVYQASFLLGFKTDSLDLLGIPQKDQTVSVKSQEEVESAILKITGKHNLPFPVFSARRVKGQPLWQWAKNNLLHKIKIPTQQMEYQKLENQKISSISTPELLTYLQSTIALIKGDFRQEQILDLWQQLLKQNQPQNFQIINITCTVSSGTYIRSLANLLANELQTSVVL